MTKSSPAADDGTRLLERTLAVLELRDGSAFRLMRKHGRVLCALPEAQDLALHAIGLYSPQRTLARMASQMIKAAIRYGCSDWILREKFVFSGGNGSMDRCGVLLGSPGHSIERAVAIFPGEQGMEVAKVAFGEAGRDVLKKEAEMLEMLGGNYGAPALLGLENRGDAAILRMPYESGRPLRNRHSDLAVGLLHEWKSDESFRSLKKFEEWSLVENGLRRWGVAEDDISALAGREVAVTLRHGDFARWNLRMDRGRELRVHDWERGNREGPAGFDLVHYFVQDALLVRGLPPARPIREMRRVFKCGAVAAYLEECGWGGREDELLAVVFALTTEAGYEDQSALYQALTQVR